jgi:IS30 family transposase
VRGVYFAHPYHAWEQGLKENTHGLIRQYFTKDGRFVTITGEWVETVIPSGAKVHKLNHRPRKTLPPNFYPEPKPNFQAQRV